MNLLFWNLGGNNNTSLVKDLLIERNVDIAVFAEHGSTDFDAINDAAGFPYNTCDPVNGAGKVRILLRDGFQGFEVFGQRRYTILTIRCVDNTKLNVVAVHLEDSRNDPQGVARRETVSSLVAALREQECEHSCNSSVVIGDFNVQPFSPELVWATQFNATSFKEVARRMSVKSVEGRRFPFMYNPTLEHLSETKANCGSYYRASGADSFYWYCFDQAIVSQTLADTVAEYKYLRQIGGISLIDDVAPKSDISDHLPLFIRLVGSETND